VPPALAVLASWTALDLLFNVRYPAIHPLGLALLPSLDATVLMAAVALLAWRGRRLPRAAMVTVAVLVVVVRVFRFGDGLVERYFNRHLDLGLDLPTTGEMVRLLRTTVPPLLLIVGVLVALGSLVAFGALTIWSLRLAERGFAVTRARMMFAAIAAVGLISLALGHEDQGLRRGLVAASVVPRLAHEARRLWQLDDFRASERARVAATAAQISAAPHGLEKLGGTNVMLFFIESYGVTVLEQPDHARLMDPVYTSIEGDLRRHGWTVASGLLASPTYAGRSWLAHQTIATGVRTGDRIADALVQEQRPPTMAHLFRDAGYRTLLVQPANTHRELYRWLYDFDRVYSSWDFDYRGPGFGFASMPDQYVVDFIHRREVATTPSGLFVEYALVTSHAPWNEQPPLVEDWSELRDGRLFATRPPIRFPVGWTTLSQSWRGYLHSIAYDLRVLQKYATDFLTGDALVIILGDHQPVAEVTRASRSTAVPVHVLCRQPALIAPFLARGYTPGMRPRLDAPPAGMESFLPALLADFSR
jgi:hypothetical protein